MTDRKTASPGSAEKRELYASPPSKPDAKVREALEPILHYVKMRHAQPLKNLGDSVHSIHMATEFEAEIKFSDLERIAALSDAGEK